MTTYDTPSGLAARMRAAGGLEPGPRGSRQDVCDAHADRISDARASLRAQQARSLEDLDRFVAAVMPLFDRAPTVAVRLLLRPVLNDLTRILGPMKPAAQPRGSDGKSGSRK